MIDTLSRFWWVPVLRGVAAIIFGILALVLPGITLLALVFMFAAYAVIDGVLSAITGFQARGTNDRWWLGIIEGIVGIVAGVLAFIWPNITAFVLLIFIAAWAIITGIIEIAGAIRLRNEIEGEWLLAIAGVLSIALGVLLFLFPGPGAVGLVWMIGLYAIMFGVTQIVLGILLRSGRKKPRRDEEVYA
ncbi:MAG: HdeD family acid-resistance protein [Chloroflexi bacterium]|nr:HdeD family acid-resistance protein [Chloroflexota bacterium]